MQNISPSIIKTTSFLKKVFLNTYGLVGRFVTRSRFGEDIKLSLGVNRSMQDIGWVSLDASGIPDIRDSAEFLLTIPDNSCQVIMASHVLEHLNYQGQGYMRVEKIIKILKTWKTKTKRGGKLYIAVPDGDFLMRGIVKRPKSYWKKEGFDWIGPVFGGMETKFNRHSMLFNFNCLQFCLKKAGFRGAKHIRNPEAFTKIYNSSAFNKGSLNVVAYA